MPKLGLALSTATGTGQLSKTTWDAYSDFYLSPTAAGWAGATTPSTLGAAWGYYAGNVNGSGFPNQIGSYFTPSGVGGNLYQYSNVAPIGAGILVGVSGWANTGGAGFPYYQDNQGWSSSLGRYDTPWFVGAPGLAQGLTNLIWLQSGWLSNVSTEGIASVLVWKAPSSNVYSVSGQVVTGDQPSNGASVAVVTNSSTPVPRTTLASNVSQSFAFSSYLASGDIVQFQVGSNFTTSNAVGLKVSITG